MGYHKSINPADIWSYSKRTISLFKVSDTVRMQDANEYTTTNTSSYDEIKKYLMCSYGQIRIKFKLKNDSALETHYKIFKNSTEVASGFTNNTIYTEKMEDIDVAPGDIITIKMQVTGSTGRMKDIRLCYDLSQSEVVELD